MDRDMELDRDNANHGGHRERLRQRVCREGLEGLKPHELVEFLLFYALPRQDVNDLAHRLVERFGDVRGVLTAEPARLARVEGMGPRAAKWLALVGEAALSGARLRPEDRPPLCNFRDAFRFAAREMDGLLAPGCAQLCLDAGGRLLYRRTICPSLSWSEPAVLREALCDVLSAEAHGAILVLRTDPRAPEPEEYDVAGAEGYIAALRAADCELLDVILLGGGAINSMRCMDLLPEGGDSPAARRLREDYCRDMPQGGQLARDYLEG